VSESLITLGEPVDLTAPDLHNQRKNTSDNRRPIRIPGASPAASRSPSPDVLHLPLVVFNLYVRQQEKYMTGLVSDGIDVNQPFEVVVDELISHVLDKLRQPNADPALFNITFVTKWVTVKVAGTVPKKGTNAVDANSFADFKQESNLLALKTTMGDAIKMKRMKASLGSHVWQVIATVVSVSTETPDGEVTDNNMESSDVPVASVYHRCHC